MLIPLDPKAAAQAQDLHMAEFELDTRTINGFIDGLSEEECNTFLTLLSRFTGDSGILNVHLVAGQVWAILRMKYNYCKCGGMHRESDHESAMAAERAKRANIGTQIPGLPPGFVFPSLGDGDE